MQVSELAQSETETKNSKTSRRLTRTDYTQAGILGNYDWSPKDREAHDKAMENYRRYLMKLCTLSRELIGILNMESE